MQSPLEMSTSIRSCNIIYFQGWDVEYLPLWLTGLILGYPIENTRRYPK